MSTSPFMKRRQFVLTAALSALGLLALAAPAQDAQAQAKPMRFVVQMSDADPAKWNLALNNIRNVQADVGAANVQVELVAYGPGIGMLKLEAPTSSRIGEAIKSGAKVLACENTMSNLRLQRADMHPDIGYVVSGVTHLVKRQIEGFAYIRP